MICSNCGSEIHEGAAFCPICGTRAAAPVSEEKQEAPISEIRREAPVSEIRREASVSGEKQEASVSGEKQEASVSEAPKAAAGSSAPKDPDVPSVNAANAVPNSNGPRRISSGPPYDGYADRKMQEKAPKEKEFFGVGAFIFCLVIIALLAGAAGMFAYKYFALLGVI